MEAQSLSGEAQRLVARMLFLQSLGEPLQSIQILVKGRGLELASGPPALQSMECAGAGEDAHSTQQSGAAEQDPKAEQRPDHRVALRPRRQANIASTPRLHQIRRAVSEVVPLRSSKP